MTYNLPLLRKERDWVAEQCALPYSESELYMNAWYLDTPDLIEGVGKTCGTTYCIAGHIVATTPGVEWLGKTSQVVVDGTLREIETWAGEQLGITPNDAWYVFHSSDDEVLDVLDNLIALAEAEERAAE